MEQIIYNQQELTFKLADQLESAVDIRFSGTNIVVNAYELEGLISDYIENIGMKLVIIDMAKFQCSMNDSTDDMPF